jgi:hypothetical protein
VAGTFRSDRILTGSHRIALSAAHVGRLAGDRPLPRVAEELLSGLPRSANAVVVVDGYALSGAPRNRVVLTPDTRPKQLASELERRLTGGPADAVRTVLLSTPGLSP